MAIMFSPRRSTENESLNSVLKNHDFVFSGHLKRKNYLGKIRMWSTYYVVLSKTSIYIFPADASRNPLPKLKASLLLYDQIRARKSKSHYNSFLLTPLISTVPELIFACVTPNERNKWMKAIHKAMLSTHSRPPISATSRQRQQQQHHHLSNGNGNRQQQNVDNGSNDDVDSELNVYDDVEERKIAINRVQNMNMSDLIDLSEFTNGNHHATGGGAGDDDDDDDDYSDSEFNDDIVTPSSILQPSAPLVYDGFFSIPRMTSTDEDDNDNNATTGLCNMLHDETIDSSEAYYSKCLFYGTRDQAFSIMKDLPITGVYLVRVDTENNRKVLTVRDRHDVVKYVISTAPAPANPPKVWLDGCQEMFDSLPHLLHHYHYHSLPKRHVQLIVPYLLA